MFNVVSFNGTSMDPILYKIDKIQSKEFLNCTVMRNSDEKKVYDTCLPICNNIRRLWTQFKHV